MKSSHCVVLVASSLAGLGLPAVACSGDDSNSPGRDAGTDTNKPDSNRADSGPWPTAYHAELNGYQETPQVVATTATGKADLVLSADKKTLSYRVQHNVQNLTDAHIHVGAAMESGSIVYSISPLGNTMEGTIPIVSADDVPNLDSAKWYINLHSSTNHGGEIRGQILHPNEILYVASLNGGQEVPPSGSAATGTAAVVLRADTQELLYHVKTSLAPTMAHIHTGLAAKAGDVAIDFAATTGIIDGKKPITAAQVTDLAEGRLYVNVHTTLKPAGEIRGQLVLPGEVLYSGSMTGAKEVPSTPSTATGIAQFILAPDSKSIRYEAVFSGMVATMAHIHFGAAGANGDVVNTLNLVNNGAGVKGTLFGADAGATDLDKLNTGQYYINAHSATYPNGEIRSQIQKP
ncbi:CHRD domain-containing protein [Pendulispora albinea]|uniref:CHRD domain-containing protein n=1 Tax=Pendulispora albinea TaxID=2741071 RepID=A0ABZ2LW03_9BACT